MERKGLLMLGLSEAHYNIAKGQAKKCSAAIKAEVDAGKKYDAVAAAIITAHHDPIATIISRTAFIWLCGYLNGQFGRGRADYE